MELDLPSQGGIEDINMVEVQEVLSANEVDMSGPPDYMSIYYGQQISWVLGEALPPTSFAYESMIYNEPIPDPLTTSLAVACTFGLGPEIEIESVREPQDMTTIGLSHAQCSSSSETGMPKSRPGILNKEDSLNCRGGCGSGTCNPSNPSKVIHWWHARLDSEDEVYDSDTPSSLQDESVHSNDDISTAKAHDSPDTLSSDEDSARWKAVHRNEFEIASNYSEEGPFRPGSPSSSSSESGHRAVMVTAVASVSTESWVLEYFADSDSSPNEDDIELTANDKWTCIRCKEENLPIPRYCSKCFAVRRSWFGPRPSSKGASRKMGLSRRRALRQQAEVRRRSRLASPVTIPPSASPSSSEEMALLSPLALPPLKWGEPSTSKCHQTFLPLDFDCNQNAQPDDKDDCNIETNEDSCVQTKDNTSIDGRNLTCKRSIDEVNEMICNPAPLKVAKFSNDGEDATELKTQIHLDPPCNATTEEKYFDFSRESDVTDQPRSSSPLSVASTVILQSSLDLTLGQELVHSMVQSCPSVTLDASQPIGVVQISCKQEVVQSQDVWMDSGICGTQRNDQSTKEEVDSPNENIPAFGLTPVEGIDCLQNDILESMAQSTELSTHCEDLVDAPRLDVTSSTDCKSVVETDNSQGRVSPPVFVPRCTICTIKTANTAFLHGKNGHLCACFRCAKRSWNANGRCPICQRPAYSIVNMFF